MRILYSRQCEAATRRAFYRTVQSLVPDDARGTLLLQFARFAHVGSVKELSQKIVSGDTLSPGTKRQILWSRCRSLGLASPEASLNALRLLLLKTLLDQGRWSFNRVAAYLGYGSVKNLSRSCRTRYGVSLTSLKSLSANVVHIAVGEVFWNGRTITIRPNQAVPFSNQNVLS